MTVAVLSERSQIRSILGAGAHFILLKPLSRDHATATLRAATALLKRERRRFSNAIFNVVKLRTATRRRWIRIRVANYEREQELYRTFEELKRTLKK